jgi:uncharacterized membrane protein
MAAHRLVRFRLGVGELTADCSTADQEAQMTSEDNLRLDECPIQDGFRMRGSNMTRIETFTDAAFAFALTLLVISLDMPKSYDELLLSLNGVPAFLLSAILLMIFWQGHHVWSRRYGLEDARTVMLSCLLVFTVLVYIYPLKFVFLSMTTWLRFGLGLPIPAQPVTVGEAADINRLFVIYGVGFVAMCVTILLLYRHAWQQREALQLNEVERYDTRVGAITWTILGSAGLLSTLMALFLPSTWVGIPGWAYMPLAFVMPIYDNRARRKRPDTGTVGESSTKS